jgi:DNA-binding winged helix-turn-helix (wHTH) protein
MTECKQLYNLETHVLISLYHKTQSIEVRHQFSQTYFLNTKEFAVLFLLALSHPKIVSYMEVIKALNVYGIKIKDEKDLKSIVNKLKITLLSFKVTNLIIHIRKTGYVISNKWVEPTEYEDKRLFNKILKYFKKLSAQLTPTYRMKTKFDKRLP